MALDIKLFAAATSWAGVAKAKPAPQAAAPLLRTASR